MPELLYGQDELVADFVRRQLSGDIEDFGIAAAIGVVERGHLVAGAVYNNYYGRDIQASIAAIGKTWASKGVLRALFAYPFLQLGCARITAQTRRSNRRAVKFLRRTGFAEEGVMRRWYADDDALLFGMLREECAWIQ